VTSGNRTNLSLNYRDSLKNSENHAAGPCMTRKKSKPVFPKDHAPPTLAQRAWHAACGGAADLAFASRSRATTCRFGTGNATREHRPRPRLCQRFLGAYTRRLRAAAGGFSRAAHRDGCASAADADAPACRAGGSRRRLWRDRAPRGCAASRPLALAIGLSRSRVTMPARRRFRPAAASCGC
jgi:hypothetical protein